MQEREQQPLTSEEAAEPASTITSLQSLKSVLPTEKTEDENTKPRVIAHINREDYERHARSPGVQRLLARARATWEKANPPKTEEASSQIIDFTDYENDKDGVFSYQPPLVTDKEVPKQTIDGVEVTPGPIIGVYTKTTLAEELHAFELCYGIDSATFYRAYLEDGVDGIPEFERHLWATTFRCWRRMRIHNMSGSEPGPTPDAGVLEA